MHWDGKCGRLRAIPSLSRGVCLGALWSRAIGSVLFSQLLFGRRFLRASKALRKPLTTSGWKRPELPSGKRRSVQNYPTLLPKRSWEKSTEPMARLQRAPRQTPRLKEAILMTILEQLSIGRVWQEEGERNRDAFRFLNGTDPTLHIPLRMTYTTRPSLDLSRK
uniref:Uncharacterized protein n=1 Tax=Heterorhabditis bacteriophora TaxID=37862 RepID=A0A1I7WPJ2_HETBA